MQEFPRIDVTPYWARITGQLVEIVEALSEDQLDRRTSPATWSVREHLLHVVLSRPGPTDAAMKQIEPELDARGRWQSRAGLQELLRESWERMERFLTSAEQLDRVYTPPPPDPELFRGIAEGPPIYPTEDGPEPGHFIAYHRLVHEVHHRACIFNVIEQLGFEMQGVRRLHPL